MSAESGDEFDLPDSAKRLPIDQLKVTSGPRIQEVDEEHVADLEESIELEGLIQPIVVASIDDSADSYEVVDGRHRKQALENLGVEEVAVYAMPGDREYVVPTRESEVDLNIQSMAANVLRREQTQAEEARFLQANIKERIIENFTDKELDKLGNSIDIEYAGARVPPALQLLYHLDNITDDSGSITEDNEWKFADDHYEELRRIRSAVGIGAPRTEAEHIQFYTDSPPEVVEAWKDEEITKTYVGDLRHIEHDALRNHALEKAKVAEAEGGYTTRDVENVRKAASYDVPAVTEAIINEDFSNLEDAVEAAKEQAQEREKEPEDDDVASKRPVEELKEELSDAQIAELTELTEVFGDHFDIADWEELFEHMVDKYENYQSAIGDLRNHKTYLQQRTNFDEYDWDASVADRDDDLHEARPLESEHLHCFFHDCRAMGEEIEPEAVDLFVFSPPYFTQRGTIHAEEWYTGDGPVDSREKLNQAYRGFLDELLDVFETVHTHLSNGGYLILVVSDIQAAFEGATRNPRYDIPSDLSHLIRHELNPDSEVKEQLRYENTIIWEKGFGSGADDFIRSGDPGDYKPNDTTERILVFRKGSQPNTGFTYDDPERYREYFDSLWQIPSDREGPHPASYPVELVKPLIELYSAPGEVVADPMVGGGTTLNALWQLNQEYESRIGYAWENFASEDTGLNYWKQVYLSFMHTEIGESDVLSGLDAFRQPVS